MFAGANMDETPQNASSQMQLEDLSLGELQAFLEKNRQLQTEIRSTINHLSAKMSSLIESRDQLESSLKEVMEKTGLRSFNPCDQFSQILDVTSWKASYPYFLDKTDFPPPTNRDDYRMTKNNYINISSLRKSNRWNQNQMKALDKAIKKLALEKLQTGLKQKKIKLEKQLEEKLACQQLLQEFEMLEDEFVDELNEKINSGRTIDELKEAIKETEEEIEVQAQIHLKEVLKDPNHEHDWDKISEVEFNGLRTGTEIKAMWKLCLHTNLSRKPWSEKETKIISELAAEGKTWQEIAKALKGRSAYQAFIHHQSAANRARSFWSETEDKAVLTAVKKLRMGNYIPFSAVAAGIPGRNAQQVGQRWRCHLDPNIYRGYSTPQEDVMLIICRFLKKMSYREISERYIIRTVEQLRKRFHHLKKSKSFGEMLKKNEIYIDFDKKNKNKTLTGKNFQKELNKVEIRSSNFRAEIPEEHQIGFDLSEISKQTISKNVKLYLKHEEQDDGKKILKLQRKYIGGRVQKVVKKEEEDLEMFYFTSYSSKRGKGCKIREAIAEKVARNLRIYLNSLNAKLEFKEEMILEDEQINLLTDELKNMTFNDEPIKSIFPPQLSTLIGYRSLLLEMARLHNHKLTSREVVQNFVAQCEKSAVFMNSQSGPNSFKSTGKCQNVHLVPSDRVRPLATVHLHSGICDGKSCPERKRKSEAIKAPLAICGNIQEFYFILDSETKPAFRLRLKKNSSEERKGGQEIQLSQSDKEVVLPAIALGPGPSQDDDHLSPQQAMDLWKDRFAALFSFPAILEAYEAPSMKDLTVEPPPEREEEPKKKTYYKKKRAKGARHWKRIEMIQREENSEGADAESAEQNEEPEKPRRKRKTAKEMLQVYSEMKCEAPVRPRRQQPATNVASTSGTSI
ncbi:uncharacterized protein LOC132195536 [Neocloeon triangulifer]|uniref:uncharacterized protein LOC132195536 n=1 Tax=Neocloeon triangulifer TaxID=2078957 RepID=UPI00286F3233|nr:uncharacterized protein LOC132195536 [Neocloeon triangulifer]XP_059473588.1 uncharacterized protein LOC132195536 [Neocloeon triangulifer]